MSLLRNAAGMLLTDAVLLPTGLVASIVLARALSVEDRGIYALVMTFSSTVGLLGLLGWPTAATYRIRRGLAAPARIAGASISGLAAVALALAALGLVWQTPLMERFFAGASVAAYRIALAFIAVRMLGHLGSNVARGVDRFAWANWHNLVSVAGIPILALGVLVLFDAGPTAFLGLLLAYQAATTGALLWAVAGVTGFSLRGAIAEARDALRFGARSWVTAISGQIHEQIDIFMLVYLLGDAEQVAYYAIAANLAQRLKILPEALGTAAFPDLAGLPPSDGARLTATLLRRTVPLVAAAAALGVLVAPWLLPLLFGEAYAHSVAPITLLLPAMAALGVYRIVFRYFIAIDHHTPNVASQLVAVALNVGLNTLWIPTHGISGAAAASLVSYAFEAVLIGALFQRRSGLPLRALCIPDRADWQSYRSLFARLRDRLRGSG